MRNWYLDKNSGKAEPRPQLWGSSETKYDDIHDLVVLRVPADQDRLSEFILNNFGIFFQVFLPRFPSRHESDADLFIDWGIWWWFCLHLRTICCKMRCDTQLVAICNTSLRLYHIALLCSQPLCSSWDAWRLDSAVCDLRWLAHKRETRSNICSNSSICCRSCSICQWDFEWCFEFSCSWCLDLYSIIAQL